MSEDRATAEADRVKLLERMTFAFMQNVPHNVALGIEVLSLRKGRARMRLPFKATLCAPGEQSGIHDVVLTSLMDACCGAAVFMALDSPRPVATLDLRVDYLAAALWRQAVIAEAHCYRVADGVAFVRCQAFHPGQDPTHKDRETLGQGETLAEATGSFMLNTKEPGQGAVVEAAASAAERMR